ncbi:MAG TPA: gas vesicle protein [Actinomycetes bacterium]
MTAEAAAFGDGSLVDLLDRLLAGGVVIAGDVTLSIADIDLVRVRLLALVSSVGTITPEIPAPEPVG